MANRTDPTLVSRTRSRYRCVSTRLWGDERFRALSAAKPNAQTLWLFLITGPLTTNVPGLMRGSPQVIADELNWRARQTHLCFAEIEAQKMLRFDRAHRVIWIETAINHNPPSSTNAVRSWFPTIRDCFPECEIVSEALTSLRQSLFRIGPSWADAFDEAFPKKTGKAYDKPSPIQEAGSRNQDRSTSSSSDHARASEVQHSTEGIADLAAHAVMQWNAFAGTLLPKTSNLAPTDKRHFAERVQEDRSSRGRFEFWTVVGERARDAEFLRDKHGGPATFAWVIATEERLTKLLSGAYDQVNAPAPRNQTAAERSIAAGLRLVEEAEERERVQSGVARVDESTPLHELPARTTR